MTSFRWNKTPCLPSTCFAKPLAGRFFFIVCNTTTSLRHSHIVGYNTPNILYSGLGFRPRVPRLAKDQHSLLSRSRSIHGRHIVSIEVWVQDTRPEMQVIFLDLFIQLQDLGSKLGNEIQVLFLSDDVWSAEEYVAHSFFLQVVVSSFSRRTGVPQHERMKAVQVLYQADLDECQGYSERDIMIVSLLKDGLQCILVMQIEEWQACVVPCIMFVRHDRIPFDKVVCLLIIAES
ncbi:hypothetical protein NXS19_006457 [Fusarium pseudograminearum]|nr:hypothetical protein NXS19_006457 [Fusarium pseudograminearum]